MAITYREARDIGTRIKQVRESRQMTTLELALSIGLTNKYIIEIEHATKQCGLDAIMKICTTLNCSADYLLFGDQSSADEEFMITDPYWSETAQLLATLKDSRRDQINNLLYDLIKADRQIFHAARDKTIRIYTDEDL